MPVTAPFDCVVLSTNLDPLYWQFFPSVARAWQKLFHVPVHLAVVGHPRREAEFRGAFGGLNGPGSVTWLRPVEGIPEPTQAKLARYYLGAGFSAQTRVLLHDIDYLPLSAALITEQLGEFEPGGAVSMVSSGAEYYTGDEAGKFMAAPLLVTSGFLARLFSPAHRGWETFLHNLERFSSGQEKMSLHNTIDHEDPATFSDESLLRYLLQLLRPEDIIWRRQRPWHPREQLIDRSDRDNVLGLVYDPTRLAAGQYAGAHLPRPLLKHFTEVHPLLEYLGI